MKKTEEILKDYIVGNIFTEFPVESLLGRDNAFDVFTESDDLAHEFILCEKYEDLSVDEIRDEMQSKLDDLLILQQTIKDNTSLNAIRIILEKSEMNEEDYDYFKEKKTATIHREDTNNEYIQFTTINLGDI